MLVESLLTGRHEFYQENLNEGASKGDREVCLRVVITVAVEM